MRWGILGTGGIAGKFAADLTAADGQSLEAVGSRSADSANRFQRQFGGRAWPSYQQLLDDPEVEAVYISLPNSLHHPWTMKALDAGKHVLCEKPIATSAAHAEEMFDAAERAGRMLIEAFMYRCHPSIGQLLASVRQGAIGRVRLIRSHFTFQRKADPTDVRYQADLGGGALMDVGCYPINLCRAIVGAEPTDATVRRHQHQFGVEDFAAGMLSFDDQTLAVFTCGMTVQADRTTVIGGESGYLRIMDPWFGPGRYEIVRPEGVETIRAESDKGRYALEAEAFARAVAGQQPPWITPEDSIGNMRVLDQIRNSEAS